MHTYQYLTFVEPQKNFQGTFTIRNIYLLSSIDDSILEKSKSSIWLLKDLSWYCIITSLVGSVCVITIGSWFSFNLSEFSNLSPVSGDKDRGILLDTGLFLDDTLAFILPCPLISSSSPSSDFSIAGLSVSLSSFLQFLFYVGE